MQSQNFTIKTEQFEGPLDLLLTLIEKRKLLINEFSLAKITDEYIQYVQKIPEGDLSNRTEFIVLASTLILIKSRSLLPNLSLSSEEESSIEDLERRLKIYQKIKDLSLHIKDSFGKNKIFFALYNNNEQKVFAPHPKINLEEIQTSLSLLIDRLPKKELVPKATIKKVITIEEMIDKLTDRIQNAIKLKFSEFAKSKTGDSPAEKVELIVSFLAMLELVKQGIISVTQQKHFDDIEMETENVAIPHYN